MFVGNQVSNWNEARLEKEQTARMLEQLGPELSGETDYFRSVRRYYDVTGRYAEVALAGWNGDRRITDPQFVIAAYQASQVYGIGINAQNWALTFGGDQMRNIDDPQLRRDLAVVLTADYEPLSTNAVATPYREHVRQLIPDAIQQQIRDACGDRDVQREGAQYFIVLPASCPLQLDRGEAARAAATLRAHRELVTELNWHLAMVDNYRANANALEGQFRTLEQSFEQRSRS